MTSAASAAAAVLCLALAACDRPLEAVPLPVRGEAVAEDFGHFVEPGFPFITTTLDAREMAATVSTNNVAVRCIALILGDSTYACFDPDLLRMSLGWQGDFVSMSTMAQVSYRRE